MPRKRESRVPSGFGKSGSDPPSLQACLEHSQTSLQVQCPSLPGHATGVKKSDQMQGEPGEEAPGFGGYPCPIWPPIYRPLPLVDFASVKWEREALPGLLWGQMSWRQ